MKNNCGDFCEKVTVEWFGFSCGKIWEIVICDRFEVIGADMVICNMDIKWFFYFILEEN